VYKRQRNEEVEMKRILVMLTVAFGLACFLSLPAQADPGGKDKRGKNREKLKKKLQHEREKAGKKTEKSRRQARHHFRKGAPEGNRRPNLRQLRNHPRFKQIMKKRENGRKHRAHSRKKCRHERGKFQKKQSKERGKARKKASRGKK